MTMRLSVEMGCVFKTTDLLKIHYHLMEFRKTINEMATRQLDKLHMCLVALQLDSKCYGVKPTPDQKACGPILWAMKNIIMREYKNPHDGSDTETDTRFNIVVIPTWDQVVGFVRTTQLTWWDSLMSQSFVDDFWYTEGKRPYDMPASDWNERKRVWGEIMDKSCNNPEAMGLTAVCRVALWFPSQSERPLKQFVPKHSERVRELAKYLCFEQYSNVTGDNVIGVPYPASFYHWLMTTKGITKFNSEQKKIRESGLLACKMQMADDLMG